MSSIQAIRISLCPRSNLFVGSCLCRSLTGGIGSIGASPALPQKTSAKKVTVLEPVEEENSLTRSPLKQRSPPNSNQQSSQQRYGLSVLGELLSLQHGRNIGECVHFFHVCTKIQWSLYSGHHWGMIFFPSWRGGRI